MFGMRTGGTASSHFAIVACLSLPLLGILVAHWVSASLHPPLAALTATLAIITSLGPAFYRKNRSMRVNTWSVVRIERFGDVLFPSRYQPSIIGAERLNFCVRNGNRWDSLLSVRNCRLPSLPLGMLCCSLGLRLASSATGGARLRTFRYNHQSRSYFLQKKSLHAR